MVYLSLTSVHSLNYVVDYCLIRWLIVHILVPLQEREMGGGIFYDTLYRETFTQELNMLTK